MRRLAVVPAVVLVLGGCASLPWAGTPTATSTPVTVELFEQAGIASELVRTTDVAGFELAPLSVGVVGDDGMSAAWFDPSGATVVLMTFRSAVVPAVPCADLDDADVVEGPEGPDDDVLRCSVEHDGVHVVLEGDGVDAATVRAAAAEVRVPRDDELAGLVADLDVPGEPVERGDLPERGDGAPVDPSALGG